jgi:hypothetical protein
VAGAVRPTLDPDKEGEAAEETGKKTFFAPFYSKTPNVCQDRLGTYRGKPQTIGWLFYNISAEWAPQVKATEWDFPAESVGAENNGYTNSGTYCTIDSTHTILIIQRWKIEPRNQGRRRRAATGIAVGCRESIRQLQL